jgi:hypothetical protein
MRQHARLLTHIACSGLLVCAKRHPLTSLGSERPALEVFYDETSSSCSMQQIQDDGP